MFIDPVPKESATGLLAEIYGAEEERWGFLPQFVQAFSHHPEAYRAWLGLITEVYGGMDRRRCELATLAAAQTLRSTCCSVAHGRMLRDRFYPAEQVHRIATDHHDADLDDVDVTVMDFAGRVASDPAGITAADVEVLRSHGLDDREIFDVVFAVAARAFFATLIEALGTPAEREIVADLEPELREALAVGRPAS